MPIDRLPRKGEVIIYDSGSGEKHDNVKYRVIERHDRMDGVLRIQNIATGSRTMVIAQFHDGFNPYLHFENKELPFKNGEDNERDKS